MLTLAELLQHIRESGDDAPRSDQEIADLVAQRTGYTISRNQIYVMRTGQSTRSTPATAVALATAFQYNVVYRGNEPYFREADEPVTMPTVDDPLEIPLRAAQGETIPVVSLSQVESDGVTEDGTMDDQQVETIERPVGVPTTAYAFRVENDRLSPDGTLYIASPVQPPQSGDLAVVKLKTDAEPRPVRYQANEGMLSLRPLNSEREDRLANRSDVEFAHKIVGTQFP